jgi:hypothetical protein
VLSRRLILLASAVTVLVLPAPASAIEKGAADNDDAYPAQVFVGRDTDGDTQTDERCVGTLVGSRQVLTAARCAIYGSVGVQPLPEEGFEILVGDSELGDADRYAVAEGGNDIHDEYSRLTGVNDVAVLTLAEPVPFDFPASFPVRVVESTETALWAPGTSAQVLGWGKFNGNFTSDVLRTGDVSIRADADCPNAGFNTASMLCAASTASDGTGNPCDGDSGSPLLVPDGGGSALAGVFSGNLCATATTPGIFARVGDAPLNDWVHDRTPEADFNLSHQPRVNEAVSLFSTSRPALGAPDFTTFHWDLDNDGAFDDAMGASISHVYTKVGEAVAGLEATNAAGDKASIYYAFDVDPNPSAFPPAQPPTSPTTTPPATNPVASAPLATILNAKRPKVRRGRFSIRIRFARAAPTGTAVIEVYRGKRRIGIARTKVRRGATKRVRVKLTPTGRRILRRADSKRLKIRVRVRVGRKLLRTKQLTIRR